MKRITPKIKKLDLIATLINLLYILLVIAGLIYLFSKMIVPARETWTQTPEEFVYNLIFGITIVQSTMNIIIALFVGFLIIAIPLNFKSFKRYFDKETIEVDEWDYRQQYLLSAFEIVTLNPFSGAIRIYLARHTQLYVSEYGMKEGIVRTSKAFAKGTVSFVKGIGRFIVSIGKFFVMIGRLIAFVTVDIARFISISAIRFGHFLKRVVLSIGMIFASKKSEKYQKLSKAKDLDKENVLNKVQKGKDVRQANIEARLAERELAKAQDKTQDELDEVTKKDFVMQIVRLALTYTILTFTALFIFIPFYWMVITALKTYAESSATANPSFFISLKDMQWVNFKIALTEFNFMRFIGNTVFVGITTMIFTVLTTILAAFAFSRLEFKGREFIFSLLLMTMMIPGELYTITNYITVSNLGWIDTMYALIVPFSASVFYIFFLRQSFRQIPDALYRAAKVDGASDFKYLTRVMIPIAAPTIITIIILSSIGAWDAYIWPQLVSRSDGTTLVSVALRNQNFSVGTGSDARPMYNLQLAAATIVTVPLIVVFFSLKKYILAGVGRSGTKG